MSWTITLSPFAALPGVTAGLSVAVEGATIFINGHNLDLSFMEEGDRIDRDAISGEGTETIKGPISLVGGTFRITLIFPYDPETASHAQLFPAPLVVTTDGPVTLPGPTS
jgi:hypothetical protein